MIVAHLSPLCTSGCLENILNYAISNTFTLCNKQGWGHIRCSLIMSWMCLILIIVFTQESDAHIVFQPRSNKAEKYDYVSRLWSVFSSYQEYESVVWLCHECCFASVPLGYGVSEEDGRKRVRGLQQCHVSVLFNKMFQVILCLCFKLLCDEIKQDKCSFIVLLYY